MESARLNCYPLMRGSDTQGTLPRRASVAVPTFCHLSSDGKRHAEHRLTG